MKCFSCKIKGSNFEPMLRTYTGEKLSYLCDKCRKEIGKNIRKSMQKGIERSWINHYRKLIKRYDNGERNFIKKDKYPTFTGFLSEVKKPE